MNNYFYLMQAPVYDSNQNYIPAKDLEWSMVPGPNKYDTFNEAYSARIGMQAVSDIYYIKIVEYKND